MKRRLGLDVRVLRLDCIFRFGSAARGTRHFIGSADAMTRNLDGRIEVVLQVMESDLKAPWDEILHVNPADDGRAWELAEDGTWSRLPRIRGLETHARLLELAGERAGNAAVGPDDLPRG